jgi:ribbon-helix-helix protein
VTVRIGWSRTDDRRPGQVAGGIRLFEFLRTKNEGRGKHIAVGILSYNRRDLERLREKGQVLDVRVIGLLRIADDVSPALARATIGTVRVTGWLRASPDVRHALAS